MNVKQQGISGYWLKVIAVVSMLCTRLMIL